MKFSLAGRKQIKSLWTKFRGMDTITRNDNSYSPPNIALTKSRKMRWVKHEDEGGKHEMHAKFWFESTRRGKL